VFELYGEEGAQSRDICGKLPCSRVGLAERNVRFHSAYHPGWDHHGGLPNNIKRSAKDIDQGCYALITDLKERGLLDDTLLSGAANSDEPTTPRVNSQLQITAAIIIRGAFTGWVAGGGFKGGMSYGATDDFGYNVVENPVHVHDLQATLLTRWESITKNSRSSIRDVVIA
jgi:hypothetical protein